ncbi:50S ribosomal protein L4 [archaeon]|nr:50S ribosomal protein L4 [archaeon]
MKSLPIYSIEGGEISKIELPVQFNEEFRPDLIRKAVLANQNSRRQPYGSSPFAGKRASAEVSKRRRKYRTCYGIGIARSPRKIMSKRGRRLNWVGAFAPNTLGGRRAHPPKATKKFMQKLNIKENRKAIRSAISKADSIILESKFEQMSKTAEIAKTLTRIYPLFKNEEEERAKKAIAKSPLLVISQNCPAKRASKNIIETADAGALNAELLAPGTNAGRQIIWTQDAIDMLRKKGLYL